MFTFFRSAAVVDAEGDPALERSPKLPLRSLLPRLFVVLGALTVAGCASGRDDATAPDSALPPYSPEAAVLFDDVLAPSVFGFDPEGRTPAKDPKLKERTRVAEFVIVARIETVSRVGGAPHHGSYEITVDPVGDALAGDKPSGPVVLRVPATNPSYTWVDGAGPRWVGSRLIVFGRHYRDDGTAALHFRCEPDTPDMRAAVDRDAGLRLLR